ncbi:efflux RND transporter periplasmic adaptor subunit [Parapedobacter sp. ISTM3]|uniref:Membrane fusion protein, multidrug efflux system n=1 Tax=Parapedobacter luteus TaxID=623280 RepID=A0A1T5CHN1_9SPHI|nr:MULTISPECIES: efflux RND transporter periplasmic adaptor subunit [Parapedobacter]MBK1438903.1 efflux RND transporter periplasmic adaptor subunit [Parapedobacter sp. ISTM3]SKB58863.1 membrane fusion protein, multidrug efflux system [Parapedobacter luteus]
MNTSVRLNTKTLIITILSGIALFFMFSCSTGSSKTNSSENNAIALPVQRIDTTTASTVKDYLGTIEGKVNVEIRPQVEGILEEIYVDEGAFVKEGQKLFKINPQPYQEELNNALANENVEKAKLENAKLEVDRLKPLVENDVISDVRLRTAMSDYDVAKASLAQASAAVASARINLEFTTIKAPVSGFIGRIPKRIGNLVGKSDALTELSDISEVYVYFAMSESDFLYFRKKYGKRDSAKVHSADTAQIIPNVSLIMADGTAYPEKGVVDAINGQVNRTTGAISLRATFPNKDNILRSGNTGTLKMEEYERGVLTVPQVATTELQDKIFVYTLSADNKVKQQAIQVAGKSGNAYIVKAGVKPGDRIVLSGLDKLSNGMEIKPLNVPASAAE